MDLEILLEKNYEQLVEPECKQAVLDFISLNENVFDRDILFIKRLTKVAQHIIKSDLDSIKVYLERLYNYNIQGTQRVSKNNFSNLSADSLINLESHLYGYAGDAAKTIFELTKDKSWAVNWYYNTKKSADMSFETDPNHSAYAYGYAGDAAKAICELTKDKSWAIHWYNNTRKSADLSIKTDPKHSVYAYGYAGDAAKILFESTGNKSWAINWYNCYRRSADMSSAIDKKHSVHAYGYAGNAALIIAKRNNDLNMAVEAKACFEKFIDYYMFNPNPKMNNLSKGFVSTVHYLRNRFNLPI